MESGLNFIRVRVDLRDVGFPFLKQAWVSVDRSVQRTIRDFKLSLYPKFKLPENRNISLYLQGCLLPEEESIFLLRDDDVIRVVCENLPSLLGSQCNDFMDFASSSRGPIRHITDGCYDVSVHAAKKARIHSPVVITESFHDISDTQNSVNDGASIAVVSSGIKTDISQTKSVRKKYKKYKKHRKEEKSNSFENSYVLENGLSNNASEAQEFGVLPSNELGSLIKGTQDQQDENYISEMICSKEQKVKEEKRSSKNVAELSKPVNETFGTFENYSDCISVTKSEHDAVLSRNSIQSNGHKNSSVPKETMSEKHEVSEKKTPNEGVVQLEKGVCVVSDGPKNCVDAKKLVGRFGDASSNVDLQYTTEVINSVTGGYIVPKTECGDSNMKNTSLHEVSKSVLIPSLHCEGSSTFLGSSCDVPLQMKGDCTQSLGNNCPKKKKRTRRGRKSRKLNATFDKINSDCSSNLLPPPTQRIGESVADFIHGVRHEHNGRKHIRFADSPASSCATMVLDNDHSRNSTDKPISVVVNTSHTSQEPFKTGLSSSYANAEKVIPNTSFHQGELASDAAHNGSADRTRSETNVQETSESMLNESKSNSYEGYPPLNRFPLVGDIIAFKMLELTDSYCPEVSDYKEGRVVEVNSSTDVLEIDLVEEQVIVRAGKFENLYPDEAPKPQVIKKVFVQWSALIEPKLIS